MRKKWVLCLAAVLACTLSGCKKMQENMPQDGEGFEEEQEQSEFQLKLSSSVSREECYICGEREDSLMPYYGKRDSIGVIHWNGPEIIDSEVRSYDEEGRELFGQEGMRTSLSSFGEGYGSIRINGTPSRGFTDIKVHCQEKDEIDFIAVQKLLCQECLDKVTGFYEDQKNSGDKGRIATTGYCLVDFTTKQLYTLSDPYRGYFIRDYYVSYEISEEEDGMENGIEIFIVYVPEREE